MRRFRDLWTREAPPQHCRECGYQLWFELVTEERHGYDPYTGFPNPAQSFTEARCLNTTPGEHDCWRLVHFAELDRVGVPAPSANA